MNPLTGRITLQGRVDCNSGRAEMNGHLEGTITVPHPPQKSFRNIVDLGAPDGRVTIDFDVPLSVGDQIEIHGVGGPTE